VSVNGIDPFRKISGEEVVSDSSDSTAVGLIRIVDLEEFEDLRDGGALIIDARTEKEFAEGHVPGAILFDYYQFGRYLEKVEPYLYHAEQIAVYCSSNTCDDSLLLAKELHSLGFMGISVYRGGMAEWIGSGKPVEKGEGRQ
jgi:rhodanese-related sulfurtransferase